jgi:DNA primase
MNNEKYVLHNWEGQNIFPKTKLEQLNQNVTDNLFTLRWYLISQFIENAKNSVSKESEIDNSEVIAEIMDYIKLKTKFSYKTGRVVVRYH